MHVYMYRVHGAYKTDRFFRETVITGRKVSVVMLSVFGPELGKWGIIYSCHDGVGFIAVVVEVADTGTKH